MFYCKGKRRPTEIANSVTCRLRNHRILHTVEVDMTSPLLSLPNAVAGGGIDAPVAAHYGSFNLEQRALEAGDGFVDLSHRGVVRVSGPDRLSWLHSLTTQHLTDLAPGRPTVALILSPQGHVEHAMYAVDDGEAFTAHVEPGAAAALVDWLDRMRFMMRVEVADVTAELAVAWRPTAGYDLVPRERLAAYAEAAGPAAGLWAFEALRIARGEPRFGLDTDHRTIPNEVGWVSTGSTTGDGSTTGETVPWGAVHLDKGCYRGQETVARVHTLGRPPRRLTLLHLDGSANRLPEHGSPLLHNGREVGFVGSAARHYELGPIALGLIKRAVPLDAVLDASEIPAAQEVVVDPEVGLHVRPLR
jgi:tRNA-modifying protein YgfZ